jgi:hypothetical protein
MRRLFCFQERGFDYFHKVRQAWPDEFAAMLPTVLDFFCFPRKIKPLFRWLGTCL